MSEPMVVRLRMHVRKMLTGNGETRATVHCPRVGRSRDSRDCFHCERLLSRWWDGERGGDVVCTAGTGEKRKSKIDFAETAARAAVHEALAGTTHCVPSDALAADVVRLLEGDEAVIAVLDPEGRAVGIVSKNALVGLPRGTRVAEAMSIPLHVLSEKAPIAHAIALMAFENVDLVSIATDEGELVGLLHARDLLRWTAEQMGYDAASASVPSARASGTRIP